MDASSSVEVPGSSRPKASTVPVARTPCDELEELRGPLDVRQRAPAQLEVEAGILGVRHALVFDAGLHPSDLPARRSPLGRCPRLPGRAHRGAAHRARGRRRPFGPRVGLAFPDLGVAFQYATKPSCCAPSVPGCLGSQVGVDRVEALRRRAPLRNRRRPSRRGRLLRTPPRPCRRRRTARRGRSRTTSHPPNRPIAMTANGSRVSRDGGLERGFGKR